MNGHNANQRHCTDQTALYQEPHLRAQPSNTNTLIIKRLQRESRDHREEDRMPGCLLSARPAPAISRPARHIPSWSCRLRRAEATPPDFLIPRPRTAQPRGDKRSRRGSIVRNFPPFQCYYVPLCDGLAAGWGVISPESQPRSMLQPQ